MRANSSKNDAFDAVQRSRAERFVDLAKLLGVRLPESDYVFRKGNLFKAEKIVRTARNDRKENADSGERLVVKKSKKLDETLRYPKITNYVVKFKLRTVIDLYRVSANYPNVERGCNFVALIIRIGATFLVFASGVVIGPGCKSYYSAKYLGHCIRIMIESVPQPVVLIDESNPRRRKLQLRTLQGLTRFDKFKVINIVANGSLNDQSIDLARQERDNENLIWNPRYFPGLKVLVTEMEVPELGDRLVTVQEFDKKANGVCMGGKKASHVYLSFQYVANLVKGYVDFNVPEESSQRYDYRCARKKELARSKKTERSKEDGLFVLYSDIYERMKSQSFHSTKDVRDFCKPTESFESDLDYSKRISNSLKSNEASVSSVLDDLNAFLVI